MPPEQALEQLYFATRELPVKADIHEQLRKYFEIVLIALRKEESPSA